MHLHDVWYTLTDCANLSLRLFEFSKSQKLFHYIFIDEYNSLFKRLKDSKISDELTSQIHIDNFYGSLRYLVHVQYNLKFWLWHLLSNRAKRCEVKKVTEIELNLSNISIFQSEILARFITFFAYLLASPFWPDGYTFTYWETFD